MSLSLTHRQRLAPLALLLAACGGHTSPSFDAGSDGSTLDAPVIDASPTPIDSATPDSPSADASIADGPVPDSHPVIDGASPADVSTPDAKKPIDAAPKPDSGPKPDAGPAKTFDLDILFVIDNSPRLAEEQAGLVAGFPAFISELEADFGVRPNLHIGVISTDVGDGSHMCPAGEGDDGFLQATPRVSGCSPPSNVYIEDIAAGAGRTTNYTGTIGDTFACIASLGTAGCGFEQPMEAMRRAIDLTHPENAGFIRDPAYLAVVFISDEDDCSAADEAIFDPGLSALFGPIDSFRCTQYGVVCDGVPVPRAAATYSSCTSAPTDWLRNPSYYAGILKWRKAADDTILVAAIVGSDSPFSVEMTGPDVAQLMPSCSTTLGDSVPAIRTRDLANAFGVNGLVRTLCAADITGDLVAIADFISGAMHGP